MTLYEAWTTDRILTRDEVEEIKVAFGDPDSSLGDFVKDLNMTVKELLLPKEDLDA